IATASILLVIIGMHWFNRISPQTQNPNIPIAINTSHPSDIVIGQLDTDPTISERLALKPTSPRWEHLNDDELIESLADAGEKAGLIQTDGKTELLTDALQPHSLTGD
ncbi:MAG TPA: hypothetical protein VHS31_07450, partial [Tepidisphaeraceae bacterium]|nr:hypothetical protein [Tepidisphaeraceae bacterium]